jgi:mannose-6-phosphate isomerase
VTSHEPHSPAGRVERPWGWYEQLASGDEYLVKRLLIRRGQRLSLQLHHHRCEHWVVVAGDGELQVAQATITATAGTSVFIPQGTIHRAQGGQEDLEIVEVQRGSWLSEADIERLADDFGRQ